MKILTFITEIFINFNRINTELLYLGGSYVEIDLSSFSGSIRCLLLD